MTETGGAGTDHDVEASIAANLATVRARVAAASDGRDVTILAVTKTLDASIVRAAVAVGLTEFGENYAQELAAKAAELDALDLQWHFIGGLQRNKIKRFGQRVAVWQTIDRVELIDELAKRVPGASLFVQVNTTGEPQKSGCDPHDATRLVDHARTSGLDVRGLMTVGPTEAGRDPRPSFEQLRRLGAKAETAELSMGMSGDYEQAVREGATLVRVGSVLFGERAAKATT